MNEELWPVLAVLFIASTYLLKFFKGAKENPWSDVIIAFSTVIAICAPLALLDSATIIWKFFLGQMIMFASFVCISRMRNRKSLFLNALAGVGSNGGWFVAMQILAAGYLLTKSGTDSTTLICLLIAAIGGVVSGRLVAVQWMEYVETRWKVRTDSVGSASLRALDGYTAYGLLVCVGVTIFAYTTFGWASMHDVFIVMTLGILQNAIYTVNARFANRDHPGWPVVTSLLSTVVFIGHWVFLMRYTESGSFMPLVLLVPYTVATVFGGNIGVVLSMVLEGRLGATVDSYTKANKVSYTNVTWHRKVLWSVAALCGVYVFFSTPVLTFFGIAPEQLLLPAQLFQGVSFEREIALVFAGMVFFFNSVTHTVSSRAGNRNHSPYHAMACVVHGLVVFGTGSFAILNPHIFDLLPVALLGSALGQLCAQRFSLYMEYWLGSLMDLPEGEIRKIHGDLAKLDTKR